MNPKKSNAASPPDPAEFKAVPWVRAIRDAMYEETKDMSPLQFAEYIAARAAKSRTESSNG